jgi:hypothetical protein
LQRNQARDFAAVSDGKNRYNDKNAKSPNKSTKMPRPHPLPEDFEHRGEAESIRKRPPENRPRERRRNIVSKRSRITGAAIKTTPTAATTKANIEGAVFCSSLCSFRPPNQNTGGQEDGRSGCKIAGVDSQDRRGRAEDDQRTAAPYATANPLFFARTLHGAEPSLRRQEILPREIRAL